MGPWVVIGLVVAGVVVALIWDRFYNRRQHLKVRDRAQSVSGDVRSRGS